VTRPWATIRSPLAKRKCSSGDDGGIVNRRHVKERRLSNTGPAGLDVVRSARERNPEIVLDEKVAVDDSRMTLLGAADHKMRTIRVAVENAVWHVASALGQGRERDFDFDHRSFRHDA
jgi:hypothetical protein